MTTEPTSIPSQPADATQRLSQVVIPLLKGPVYAERKTDCWSLLLGEQASVRSYLAVLGLELYLDETEGFAFVRQVEPPAGDDSLPRLVQRRPLGHGMSVFCLLLRKWLLQHDAQGGEPRAILTLEAITDELSLYLPPAKSEAKAADRIQTYIRQAVDAGLLKELKGDKDRFEILRITRALINAAWLGDLDERLRLYAEHAALAATEAGDE